MRPLKGKVVYSVMNNIIQDKMVDKQTVISVIIPVYNIEKYLHKCIQSILAQTYPYLEILLVDDGSVDTSGAICDQYAKKDKRIRVLHKENGGLSDARNAGIDAATGDYILFVDGDDFISSRMVEMLLTSMQKNSADMAMCGIRKVNEDGISIPEEKWKLKEGCLSEDQYWQLMYNTADMPCVVAWNKLYKKELFEQVRYPKGKLHEDVFVIHEIVSQCRRISVTEKELYNYVQRRDSIMGQGYNRGRLQTVEAFAGRMDYFLKRGKTDLAWQTTKRMQWCLAEAYKKLDMAVVENQQAFQKGKRLYRQYIKKCEKNEKRLLSILKAYVFIISPKCYLALSNYRQMIGRGKRT